MVFGKDHANGRNAEAPADVIEEIGRTEVDNDIVGENLNDNFVSMSFSEISQMPSTHSEGSSKNKRRRADDQLGDKFKEVANAIVEAFDWSSTRLSQAM
ncbi:hypothetical protein Dsin_012889 [Dipteronia sinensis]|uniref:Uncharacterized protein n=1 Tax=Dipteronia sinensis TaxID=43782 RepID=A0AAE0E8L5_9ROSI|nr:hypothetical protein Dsin_012889 [Dipteronia sinensis]